MPPEPLPWDRKDFFREKKYANAYDRVSEPLGGSSARWRDPPFHGSRNNDFNRGGFPSDFRRPPGHEYPPARSGERFFQGGGGGFRPSGPARDNRYNRNFRDSRTSINQRDWRGNSYDYNYHHGAPSSGPGRFYEGKDQKSVEAAPARLSRPPMDVADTSNPVHSEDRRDESCDVNKEDTSKEVEKEEPLASDWKPFNWSRPVSLTSKGLVDGGLASSSKGSGEIFSGDVKIDLPLKISTPDESFSGDAVGCLASPTSPEDTSSRKKPRLGWGEGLAKFEKKRVDPDDPQTKGSNAQCTSNSESMHSPAQNSVDKSPRFGGSFELRSPTTPSSAAYMPMFTSRSPTTPGLEDKPYMKASEFESDGNKVSVSLPSISKVQNHFAGVSLNLQDMDNKEFGKLNGLLADLLQKEVFSSLGSGSAKPALNKFLSWKGDISKVLESTESEIDTLENELKSLKPVPGSNNPVSNPSSSFSLQCKEKKSAQLNVQRSQSLPAFSSHKEKKTKEDCIESPGTATSKFTELSSLNKPSSPDQLKSFLESDKYEAGPESETKMADGADEKLEDNSLDNILFANKRTAFEASKLLDKYLPGSDCVIESVETISSTCSPNRLLKEKFLKRKKALAFKERLLSIKYRALQYMWKEDLQVLSEKKQRTRSLKQKAESSSRSLHSSFQKHRSSVRSCPPSPASNMSLVPRSEVLNFTRKLLSDPQIRCYRNGEMKMPPLILDKQEKMLPGFLSKNGLVQDPYAVEKERALINPWNAEEKEIFLDKYAAFGKDFAKISSFLDHKTTADCIEFYYKNHKADCFKKAKKQQGLQKQQTSAPTTRYLITSEKWKSEKIREMDDERETEAADVLAGICGSLSSEAMSSCITSSADPGDGAQDCKSWKTSSEPCPPTAEVDDDTCSDESCGYVEPVDWTDEEKSAFVQAFASHGKDFGMISRCVETKTVDQCKVFFSKARKCLGLEMQQGDEEIQTADDESGMISRCVQTKTRDEEMQAADDLDGGRSDTEDACVVVNENDMNFEARVEERSLNQEDEQGKTPDEVVAEISTRNPQLDLDFAPPGSELKRSASVNDLHHGESSPDSLKRSLLLPTTEASVEPLQVYHLKKCNRSASVQLLGESSSSSHHHQNVSNTSEKPCKDVKLFGQILSKPSSTTDKSSSNGSLGLETFPARKYSFWDGNKTPDSALILARYPGIFNTCSSLATEQKLPLLANVASSNSNLGFGSYQPIFPTLSEVPRNGFEAVPGLKQIELNVVDSSESRSVGSFNGLTDPVAALKLHYAKTRNLSGGDLGR